MLSHIAKHPYLIMRHGVAFHKVDKRMGDHPFPFLDKCIPVVKTVVIVELCAAMCRNPAAAPLCAAAVAQSSGDDKARNPSSIIL